MQGIGLVCAPIITRLYEPSEFGLAAMFGAIGSIVGVTACLSYDQAIILPNNERQAVNIVAACIIIAASVSIGIALLLACGAQSVALSLGIGELVQYLWILPIVTMASGTSAALTSWNLRKKKFGRISSVRISSQIIATASTLALGLNNQTAASSLIASTTIGQLVSSTILTLQIWRRERLAILQHITIRAIVVVFKRYKSFPIYTTPSALLNMASWQLPLVLFGVFFTPQAAGAYALGFRTIQTPMGLIGSSIGSVFCQTAAENREPAALAELVQNVLHRLLILGILPTVLLTIFAGDVFSAVFGEMWREAGLYVQILSGWALIWFVTSPLSGLYYVLERQREELRIQIIILVTRLGSILIGCYAQNPRIAIGLYSLSGILAYLYVLRQILAMCKLEFSLIYKKLIPTVLKSSIYVIPVLLADQIGAHGFITTGVAVLAVVMFYNRMKGDLFAGTIGQLASFKAGK